MLNLVARSSVRVNLHAIANSQKLAVRQNVRNLSVSAVRNNLVADLYLKELKAFKPTPLSAADAEAATKAWKLPQAAKVPALEAEGADALAEYDSSKVEVAENAGAATTEEYNPDDWFVFEEEEEPGHHH
ncbi:hypothetical protein OGAPHI_007180 [Ogataea philodendri]|uniref:ATP synthase subunit H, mitochondrial n=1 Tax=Ogataea philodendri TaxID=1378263 RepID=A0A9P8SZL4_9ASCO|nr:uncharacterized protein OGAPHI_007180 [Ogataea philodendri]KAH3659975.1 hypothetical protein OGAPHI_007180 [Ogataea philodendri]